MLSKHDRARCHSSVKTSLQLIAINSNDCDSAILGYTQRAPMQSADLLVLKRDDTG